MKESMVDKYLDELWLRPHVYIYIHVIFIYVYMYTFKVCRI